MQFINIVVHSVENMNFRVHLQYEFTQLGLDQYLEVSLVSVHLHILSTDVFYAVCIHEAVHDPSDVTHNGLFVCVCQQSLKDMESDKLQVQIQAYLDNIFDVGTLLEDAENKGDIMEHVTELQDTNAQVKYTPSTNTFAHLPHGTHAS